MEGNIKELVVQPRNELSVERLERPLTVEEVMARSKLVKDVIAKVMEKDKHYGTIPGCGDKPTLYQSGAQQLGVTFNLAAEPQIVGLVDTPDEYSVTVKVTLCSPSGICVSSALGECSSMEEKYHWRRTVCDEEFDETPENKKREKWFRGKNGGKNYKVKQIIVNPKDVANTILKMAVKRGYVASMLMATAASDQFTQDIEDMQRELLNEDDDHAAHEKGKSQPREQKSKPKPDVKLVKKAMDTIKLTCGGDDKKVAEIIKQYFSNGINNYSNDEIERAIQLLEAQTQKANEQPKKESVQVQEQGGNKPIGNGKEKGLRTQIKAKLINVLKTEVAVNNWLKDKFNISLDALDGLDEGQLNLIMEAVD